MVWVFSFPVFVFFSALFLLTCVPSALFLPCVPVFLPSLLLPIHLLRISLISTVLIPVLYPACQLLPCSPSFYSTQSPQLCFSSLHLYFIPLIVSCVSLVCTLFTFALAFCSQPFCFPAFVIRDTALVH